MSDKPERIIEIRNAILPKEWPIVEVKWVSLILVARMEEEITLKTKRGMTVKYLQVEEVWEIAFWHTDKSKNHSKRHNTSRLEATYAAWEVVKEQTE